ncbi:mitochondrial 37S ribosomal protein uS19m [Lipomyces oligophaga]|uniref:mitochondrial 37S ribosomal protein uS19m n=1 Tax=Lipomyces oligophaga TaxID=45792 RepID=UPI0034CE9F96
MRPSSTLLKRSVWKGPFVYPLPVRYAREKNAPIQTAQRSATILPSYIGLTFQVHNGMEFFSLKITEEMVGYKLGEFVPTRKRFSFKGQMRR